jgi:hypothetical protein
MFAAEMRLEFAKGNHDWTLAGRLWDWVQAYKPLVENLKSASENNNFKLCDEIQIQLNNMSTLEQFEKRTPLTKPRVQNGSGSRSCAGTGTGGASDDNNGVNYYDDKEEDEYLIPPQPPLPPVATVRCEICFDDKTENEMFNKLCQRDKSASGGTFCFRRCLECIKREIIMKQNDEVKSLVTCSKCNNSLTEVHTHTLPYTHAFFFPHVFCCMC